MLSSTLEQLVAALGLEIYVRRSDEARTAEVDPPWVAGILSGLSNLQVELEGLRGDL